jgi:NADH-quinone oxidoreductase subunit J
MNALFYVSGGIGIIAGVMVVTGKNVMHALINLVVLLLAIASVFFCLGAPFVAVLQIVIYAGAIMVLFVFVVMMLNLGREAEEQERNWLSSVFWRVPAVLAAVLLAQFVVTLAGREAAPMAGVIGPKAVGRSLYTDYLIGVELASLLLLAGLVAAFRLGFLPGRLERDDE